MATPVRDDPSSLLPLLLLLLPLPAVVLVMVVVGLVAMAGLLISEGV